MKKNFLRGLLLVVIFGFIPLLGLFYRGLPITHDGIDHAWRIASFYQSLMERNIFPRWAGNLNWGYGHPIFIFLYPLPSYLGSFFHFFGFSLVDSIKIVFGSGFLLSGVTMYFWLSEITEIPESVLGAVMYMVTPYRLVDLYVRGDIGENLAFAFVPLLFYFLVKLYRKQSLKNCIGIEISLAFLILSHNAISLMFLPLILFYIIYLFGKGKQNKRFLMMALFGLFFGFCLSAFFWIPGVLEGKYTLRNIVTKDGYAKNFAEFRSLVYGSWSYGGSGLFTVQLGILNWLGIFVSPALAVWLFFKKNKRYIFIIVFFLYTLFAIFFMLKQSNFIWSKFLLLQNFQFPWRFLAVTVFTTSVLLTLFIAIIPGKRRFVMIVICFVMLFVFEKNYWHAKGYLSLPDKQFTGVYHGTTDTGESAPVWSVRFMEKEPKAHIEMLSGQGSIHEMKRKTTQHTYILDMQTAGRIRENTLYFPGWYVLVDGRKTPVQFQDPKSRGLLTFFIPKGKHTLSVTFVETKVRLFADLLGLFTLASTGIYAILKLIRWQRFQ